MILLPLLLVCGTIYLGLRFMEYRLTYRRSREHVAQPEDEGLQAEEISFMAEDAKRLHGWWFEQEHAQACILLCHGNGGNISQRLWMVKDLLNELPVNVFLFDYRGYGLSKGFPSPRGTRKDACAAFEVVRARYADADQPPVLALGRSLGGAVAAQLARDKPLAGLVLESTFSSLREMGKRFYPWLLPAWTASQRYNTQAKVSELKIPKIIAHSPDDERIPYDMGQAIFRDAAEPKRFIELRGTHREAGWQTTPAYFAAIKDMVHAIPPMKHSPPPPRD